MAAKLNTTWRGKTAPKRGICPSCEKRGLGQSKPVPTAAKPTLVRQCRYCTHVVIETFE